MMPIPNFEARKDDLVEAMRDVQQDTMLIMCQYDPRAAMLGVFMALFTVITQRDPRHREDHETFRRECDHLLSRWEALRVTPQPSQFPIH